MSEVSLDKLIESIKSDAIEAARKEAKEIVDAAKEEARTIVDEARAEKKRVTDAAQSEADSLIATGESTLRQAARDIKTSMRNDILELLSQALDSEIKEEFNADVLSRALPDILSKVGDDVELRLSDDLADELAAHIHSKLKANDSEIVTSRDPEILRGVKLIKTDEGWSYDITADAISEMLSTQLTDRWVSVLEKT